MRDESVLISVIIPTYNRVERLPAAIDSLIQQSYSNWECIIIDDGSTDETEERIREILDRDSRVQYYYQENQERSIARNNGIEHSTGEYICFLDSDDRYDTHYLENIVDVIKLSHADMILTSVKYCSEESTVINLAKPKELTLDSIFSSSFGVGRCAIKKAFLGNIRFEPHIRISEDTIFLCDILAKNPSTGIAPKSFLEYIKHEDNSVNFKKYNAYKERLDALHVLLRRNYADKFSKKIIYDTLSDCYFGISKYYFYKGRYWRARMVILKSIIKYPTQRLKEKFYLFLFVRNKDLYL
jgi:glycosyltransferase involved in cell wall biosynthesis